MVENSANTEKSQLSKVRVRRIIYPIIIGLGVSTYLLINTLRNSPHAFDTLEFSWYMAMGIAFAILMMAFRDFGYMLRIRILTGNRLSWKQAFNVIMLWEFTSAITPSAVGGTSIAILYVTKEGLSVGRSSAVVMATSFLDELYFILVLPLAFFLVGGSDLFLLDHDSPLAGFIPYANRFFYTTLIGYIIKFTWVALLGYGLFKDPQKFKSILLWFFRFPFLKKWRHMGEEIGDEIILGSTVLTTKGWKFWLKALGATAFSWTGRFWVVNMLFIAFAFHFDQALVFARQLALWILMLIFPTPGGSGFSEVFFMKYFSDFIVPIALAAPIALLWRLISYYPYLFIGAIVLPRWIKSKFGDEEKIDEAKTLES